MSTSLDLITHCVVLKNWSCLQSYSLRHRLRIMALTLPSRPWVIFHWEAVMPPRFIAGGQGATSVCKSNYAREPLMQKSISRTPYHQLSFVPSWLALEAIIVAVLLFFSPNCSCSKCYCLISGFCSWLFSLPLLLSPVMSVCIRLYMFLS